jgi:antitoxin VapB
MDTAKIFTSGRSQAVRLPKEYRFKCNEVAVRRIGAAVLLFPPDQAWNLMGSAIGQVDKNFMENRRQPQKSDKRKPL